MKICEYCEEEHDGLFATGRFCNRSCSNGFSTKYNRKETNEKVRKTLLAKNPWDRSERSCEECINKFIPKRKVTRFCSSKCARIFNFRKATEANRNNDEYKKKQSIVRKEGIKSGKINISGGHTKWLPYKDIKVQGTYELRMCIILDKMKDKGLIVNWEYTNDRFCYIGLDNEEHTYLIDFKIYRNNETFFYIETKGYEKENDQLKWDSVKDQGFELLVMFGEDIERLEENIITI